MDLTIKSRTVDNIHVLDLAGKVVLGEECNRLREAVKKLLAEEHKKILLNLAAVSFIDSSGVGTLVSIFTSVKGQGGELKLCQLTQKFHETLQITRLLTVFEVYPAEAEALASFR